MATMAMVPSLISIIKRLLECIELDASEIVTDVEAARDRFISVAQPSIERRFAGLPEDDVRKQIMANHAKNEAILRQLFQKARNPTS